MHDNVTGSGIDILAYAPEKTTGTDLEIFSMSSLRARVPFRLLSGSRRYSLYMILLVTHGKSLQLVDDIPVSCSAGTVILIRPGQIHHFGVESDWDGWLMLFRPEILWPHSLMSPDAPGGLLNFPGCMTLSGDDFRSTERLLIQMRADIQKEHHHPQLNQLLFHQLTAFVIRLQLSDGQHNVQRHGEQREYQFFMRFMDLIEKNFSTWHQVNQYATAMSCSVRSLTRSSARFAGCSAKASISERISLEAKRLLLHTPEPVHAISNLLGFDEPTHFIKFFKNSTGLTPDSFRTQPDRYVLPSSSAQRHR
ncbi:AraC family transcriptional regulator [Pantoea stewartii]|uniref:helix-turn-helix transcriptional regulator n=1 Tax=Pantoea stewartii TaxID=66269 RepID=UPI00345BDDA6